MSRFKYWNILIPVIVALVLFLGFLGVMRLFGSGENEAQIDLYDGKNVRLVIGAALISLKNPPIIRDNEIAIDVDVVRTYFDPNLHWDPKTKKVTVTTKDRLVRMNTGNLETFVNDDEVTLNMPAFEEAGIVYLPMKFLSEFYQIDISYNESNKVVMIDQKNIVIQKARIIADGAVIRSGRSTGNPILKRYDSSGGFSSGDVVDRDAAADSDNTGGNGGSAAGDASGLDGTGTGRGGIDPEQEMYVFEHYDNWYRVRSAEGIVGYIEKKFVSVSMFVDQVALAEERDAAWKPELGKISMVWEQVSTTNPNVRDIGEMPELDVISPTWFDLTGADGEVGSKASAEYIEWAHNNGYQVWALFRNNAGDIEMTSEFLNSGEAREKAIRSVLAYASILGIDGINLDFEYIYLRDKDMLTQFVRELAPMVREQGLTFSVCVNIPDGSDNWSKCYDSPRIAEAADYIVVMATFNFMIRKDLFEQICFDETISGYGHEDTLFGWALRQQGVIIKHIDNPLIHISLDDSTIFISKIENSVKNLWHIYLLIPEKEAFAQENNLLQCYLTFKKHHLTFLISIFSFFARPILLRNLKSKHPKMLCMDLFKLVELNRSCRLF